MYKIILITITLITTLCTSLSEARAQDCSALHLAKHDRWDAALSCAKDNEDRILYKLVQWMKYKDEDSSASFEEIINFVNQNPNFPDSRLLIAKAERELNNDTDKNLAKNWFIKHYPITTAGMKYYLSLLTPDPKDKKFVKLVKDVWKTDDPDPQTRQEFLAKYNRYISHADNVAKLDYLIGNNNRSLDVNLLKLVNNDYQALFKARLLLRQPGGYIKQILSTAPKSLRTDPSLLYAEASWYFARKRYNNVAQIIMSNANIPAIKSDKWFKMRTRVIVELLDEGEHNIPYNLAVSHHFKEPVNYVDAEWLAGKIAYMYLRNYGKAFVHFKNIKDHAKRSVSIARGAYWTGLTSQRLGEHEVARKYFLEASKYGDTFYGQLAILKLGKDNASITKPASEISKQDSDWAQNNELVRASFLLLQDSQYSAARKFIIAAVKEANSGTRKYLLAKFGQSIQLNTIGVVSGKESAQTGTFFVEYAYPILPDSYITSGLERALAFSIIRQESEFHQHARSGKDAMGLMQLLHSTARECARDLDIARMSKMSLCRDPKLNVKLGSHYLAKLIKNYHGSYVLAIAAYNAGQGAVDKWIKQHGDPRTFKNFDKVVDWIEMTPFYETRSYVHHVLSNLQVYRSILQHPDVSKLSSIKINLAKDLLRH